MIFITHYLLENLSQNNMLRVLLQYQYKRNWFNSITNSQISLGEEFGNKVAPEEAFQEAADEEIITAGAFKIKLMYDKAAATGGEVCFISFFS